MYRKVFIPLIATVVMLGCKKNNDMNVQSTHQQRQALMVGKWQLIKTYDLLFFEDTIRREETHPFDHVYINDDYFVFNADYTFEFNDNLILNPYDTLHVYNGIWTVNPLGDTLEMKHTYGEPVITSTTSFVISALNDIELIISQDVGFGIYTWIYR